jgi:PilZ domain
MLEETLSSLHPAGWVPPMIGAACTSLVLLATRAGRRSDPPAPLLPPVPAGGFQPVDPFWDGARLERRSSLRRGGNHLPVLLSDAEVEAWLVRGTVLDRSSTGLAIAVDEPVRPGEVLSVRVAANSQEMPWVRVAVRHFRREGSYYLLGCQFLRPQPWSVLLLFG